MSTETKHRKGNNVDWKKTSYVKNADMDKTSKSKKRRLEIMSTGKNANMDKTSNYTKMQTGKTLNGKNVDKATKGRREKH